jgi:hypothetical protein
VWARAVAHYPRGDISARLDEIRKVLQRKGVLERGGGAPEVASVVRVGRVGECSGHPRHRRAVMGYDGDR